MNIEYSILNNQCSITNIQYPKPPQPDNLEPEIWNLEPGTK